MAASAAVAAASKTNALTVLIRMIRTRGHFIVFPPLLLNCAGQ